MLYFTASGLTLIIVVITASAIAVGLCDSFCKILPVQSGPAKHIEILHILKVDNQK